MSPCAFTWCVYTGVWCILFNAMVRKKREGWSREPSSLFWNWRDVSLQLVSWKSKISVGGYGLRSGEFRTRSFSRTLYGRWHQDDHHWGRVSVWLKSEKFICDHCTLWSQGCQTGCRMTLMQFWYCTFSMRGPGSVVGIATAYGLDGPGIESRWGEIFRTSPDWPWGPPSLLYNGYWVFPGGKVLPGRDADLSPPSSAEV